LVSESHRGEIAFFASSAAVGGGGTDEYHLGGLRDKLEVVVVVLARQQARRANIVSSSNACCWAENSVRPIRVGRRRLNKSQLSLLERDPLRQRSAGKIPQPYPQTLVEYLLILVLRKSPSLCPPVVPTEPAVCLNNAL
jgi:hypothetical protein